MNVAEVEDGHCCVRRAVGGGPLCTCVLLTVAAPC